MSELLIGNSGSGGSGGPIELIGGGQPLLAKALPLPDLFRHYSAIVSEPSLNLHSSNNIGILNNPRDDSTYLQFRGSTIDANSAAGRASWTETHNKITHAGGVVTTASSACRVDADLGRTPTIQLKPTIVFKSDYIHVFRAMFAVADSVTSTRVNGGIRSAVLHWKMRYDTLAYVSNTPEIVLSARITGGQEQIQPSAETTMYGSFPVALYDADSDCIYAALGNRYEYKYCTRWGIWSYNLTSGARTKLGDVSGSTSSLRNVCALRDGTVLLSGTSSNQRLGGFASVIGKLGRSSQNLMTVPTPLYTTNAQDCDITRHAFGALTFYNITDPRGNVLKHVNAGASQFGVVEIGAWHDTMSATAELVMANV